MISKQLSRLGGVSLDQTETLASDASYYGEIPFQLSPANGSFRGLRGN